MSAFILRNDMFGFVQGISIKGQKLSTYNTYIGGLISIGIKVVVILYALFLASRI